MIGLAGMVGSSPPVRGTFSLMAHGRLHARLIPARAGNIHSQRRARPCPPAHPHSRREHAEEHALHGTDPGPSPLTRGTPKGYRPAFSQVGLIPARAGNILLPLQISGVRSAHPSYCGEHTSPTRPNQSSPGSSPLARGARRAIGPNVETVRLIPARAGNTSHSAHETREGSAHPRSRGEHICA